MTLTDDHRVLTQYLMSQKLVKETDLHTHFPKTRFEGLVHGINGNLQALKLEIKRIVDEEDGVAYWGVVNLKPDELSQMATLYTKSEIDCFKLILNRLIQKGSILYEDGIEIDPHLSRDRGETVLLQLIEDKWLERDGGEVFCGLRTRLELRPYLEEAFGDNIIECVLCTEIVFKGETCENETCTTRLHRYCAKKWFEDKPTPECPSCKSPWEEDQ